MCSKWDSSNIAILQITLVRAKCKIQGPKKNQEGTYGIALGCNPLKSIASQTEVEASRDRVERVDVVSCDVHQTPMWTLPSPFIVAYLSVLSLSFRMLLSFTLGHSRAEAPFFFL